MLLFALATLAFTVHSPATQDTSIVWRDVRELAVEGQGWSETAAPFDRLPARAEGLVREPVWQLSHDSAGILVRFRSNATRILARWTLTSAELALPHMPATGVSGLDLYVRNEGTWRWLGTGRPRERTNTSDLASGLPEGTREYLLYLPLYNGVTSVELGVSEDAELTPAPPRPAGSASPVVFYGTSITQGACASRPGMAHTAILGRWLERPVVNLGFSGNGTMDLEIAHLMGELDAAAYVVDCLPNMRGKTVTERVVPFVKALREKRPKVPILLVEDRTYANAFLKESARLRNAESRVALRAGFEALVAEGDEHLHYLAGEDLLGADGEATVDSSHPTDLGFVRLARAFRPVLETLLRAPPESR